MSTARLVKGIKNPILFPQVASQNKKVKQFQEWLEHQDTEKVPPYRAYGDYASLLDLVAKKSGLASPEAVEMILFANAETLIDQVAT